MGDVSGAGEVLQFADGPELVASPLTDRHIVELEKWAQGRLIENARNSLTPGMNQAQRDETMALAMMTSLSVTLRSEIGAAMIGTVDGMSQLVWRMISVRHPEVTIEEIRALMFNPKNIERATEVFERLKPSRGTAGPPRRSRRPKNGKGRGKRPTNT